MMKAKYLKIYFEFQKQSVNIHSEDNVPYIVACLKAVVNEIRFSFKHKDGRKKQ